MKELNLNARLWIVFGLVSAAVLGAGYLFYTDEWTSYQAESQRLELDIDGKKARLRQILAQKQRLRELESEIELAQAEFEQLKEMFPDEELIPKRLFDITTVTRRALAVPTRFLPQQTETKEFYKENHYAITINAGYHSLGLLFGEIANFRYPTVIRKMKIERHPQIDRIIEEAKDHGEIPKTLIASFQLTTFTSRK